MRAPYVVRLIGLDLDHFFIPKSYGGNFALRLTSGIFYNNCIPLCESCNRSKSDINWDIFVRDKEKIIYILSKNRDVNKIINSKIVETIAQIVP